MSDRATSLLTDSQRDYLRGDTDITRDAERKKRNRIRDRVRAGIIDFPLLVATVPGTKDWEQLFEDYKEYTEWLETLDERDDSRRFGRPGDWVDENRRLSRGFHAMIELAYRVVGQEAGDLGNFEALVATAVERAETTADERASVTVDIEIDRADRPTELLEKQARGDELTEAEVRALQEAGELDPIQLLRNQGHLADETDDEN